MYNEDGIKLYDYGNGDNAGMERSLFPNSNALSDSRLNKQEAEGNAFNGTGYIDVTFLKDFKFTFNAGVSLDETRSTSVTNPGSDSSPAKKAWSRRAINGISTSTYSRFSTTPSR